MWLTLIPQILAFIVTLFLVEPKLHSNKETNIYAHLFSSFNQFRHNYKLRLVSFASIIDFAFGETGFQFKPVFVNSLWPIWAVGLAQTFSFIGGSISFYFSGSVIKRFGEIRSLVYENIISRIIGVIALVFPTVLSPALLSVTSLMFGVTQVAKNSLMQKEFTNEQRATLGSINSLLASISFAIVSFILGFTADQIGPVKALLLINLVLFFPLYLYWKIFTHNKQP
jgi:MFS family permease